MNIPTWQWIIFGILFLMGALLTLGAIPRNRWVGLRTARTLATRSDWNRAHRALGLITLGLLAIAVLLKVWPVHPLFDAIAGIFSMIGAAGSYAIVHRKYAV
jgi:hypothetical protein